MSITHELNALLAIAYRDLLKFLRDRSRLVGTLVFPAVFIIILGGAFGAAAQSGYKFEFQTFIFLGVFAQNMWSSAATGIISLIEDRENDFSQAIFVAPLSRYTILGGKILGESLVALTQGVVIFIFGLVIGVHIAPSQMLALIPVAILICLYGGVFPFILLPQFFLGGVFTPVDKFSPLLAFLSRISPLRYAVDLMRGVYYGGVEASAGAVLASQPFNLAVMAATGSIFVLIGTALFVRKERMR